MAASGTQRRTSSGVDGVQVHAALREPRSDRRADASRADDLHRLDHSTSSSSVADTGLLECTAGTRSTLPAMPIYEYVCMRCEHHFEELVRGEETPACPSCEAETVRRKFSRRRAARGARRRWRWRRLLRRELWLLALRSAEVRRAELAAKQDASPAARAARSPQGRTQVVFGSGNPDAELMFVGEAPGFHEDQQGIPFVGAAGKLLEKLLADIGMTRDEVFIANVLKCRPPGNRDPLPEEIASCEPHLFRQLELIRPTVVATLGNFATKLLSGKPTGITRVHGVEQHVTIGSHPVVLFPLYHPAAALYTRAMLGVLEEDFRKLPALLARARGEEAPPAPVAPTTGRGSHRACAGAGRPPGRRRRAARPVLGCGSRAQRRRTPRRSRPRSRRSFGVGDVVTSRASSARARRPSSAAPAARSASPSR